MATIVEVTNRNNGYTGYKIPETGVVRSFAPDETKKIDLDELKQLSYVRGGEYLLKHFLIINDKDALSQLNFEVEPEYFYTKEEITNILTTGSMDRLEDTLNFAPEGVLELIKDIAVKIELPDTRKRQLILERIGFNVDTAIQINKMLEDENTPKETEPKKTRKVAVEAEEDAAPKRKIPVESKKEAGYVPPADKYKVVVEY